VRVHAHFYSAFAFQEFVVDGLVLDHFVFVAGSEEVVAVFDVGFDQIALVDGAQTVDHTARVHLPVFMLGRVAFLAFPGDAPRDFHK